MFKKNLIVFILLTFSLIWPHYINGEIIKVDTIKGLIQHIKKEKKDVIVFSSRYYIDYILGLYEEVGDIYWVLPVNEIKEEDLEGFKNFLDKAGIKYVLDLTSEGISVKKEGGLEYKILPYTDIKKAVTLKCDIILDIEFFFRIYYTTISRVNNEKTLEIMKFFRSVEEYDIKFDRIYLVLSKDISLPEWVNEFGYIIERIYPYWEQKVFPAPYVLLDEVEKYLSFAQFEEAYEILLQVFPYHVENPYYYEKMMLAAARLYIFEDAFKSFEEGYKINSHIITLVPEVVRFFLDKDEYYPAYLLTKKALDAEPWNREIKELFKEVINSGYSFYNRLHEDDELFKFFKEELQKLKK